MSRAHLQAANVKVAVVDDDPTGTQTVRDVPLITSWDEAELAWAMAAATPLFGVLTNSRALPEERAVAINREIGRRLAAVARRLEFDLRVISRSDSTLRGHFPAEPEALADGLGGTGDPIDCVLVCPSFPEAGRVTTDDVHWVVQNGRRIPVAETEYARDPAFAYTSSNLVDWVRERAGDKARVGTLDLEQMRRGGSKWVAERLLQIGGEARYVIANAAEAADLDVLAQGIELAERRGLRLVYRTGPSFLSARVGRPTAAPLSRREVAMPGGRGMLVVGSHTERTTSQLGEARVRHDLGIVTIDANQLLSSDRLAGSRVVARAAEELGQELGQRDTALVTSRRYLGGRGGVAGLRAAAKVADAVVDIVRTTASQVPLRWLVAKGGITSHDTAVRALGARRATVLGQLFPGQVSVWELGEGSIRPGLRFVVFPGNVGDDLALARTLDRLKGIA